MKALYRSSSDLIVPRDDGDNGNEPSTLPSDQQHGVFQSDVLCDIPPSPVDGNEAIAQDLDRALGHSQPDELGSGACLSSQSDQVKDFMEIMVRDVPPRVIKPEPMHASSLRTLAPSSTAIKSVSRDQSRPSPYRVSRSPYKHVAKHAKTVVFKSPPHKPSSAQAHSRRVSPGSLTSSPHPHTITSFLTLKSSVTKPRTFPKNENDSASSAHSTACAPVMKEKERVNKRDAPFTYKSPFLAMSSAKTKLNPIKFE